MRQHKENIKRRSAVSIAHHLNFVLRIQAGRELVLFLGKGNERNNQSAVQTWVLGKINMLQEWPVSQVESKLYVKELELEIKELLLDLTNGWE